MKEIVWYKEIYKHLIKARDIAEVYSNPLQNDSGGSDCCYRILKAITPLIEELEYDVKNNAKKNLKK